jgi:cysteine synthase
MNNFLSSAFARFGFTGDPSRLVVYLPETSRKTGNRVWAFLGGLLPTGSLKFISALGALAHLGSINSNREIKNVIASTSGNLGLAGAALLQNTSIAFHAVVDVRTPVHKLEQLRQYGAIVDVVEEPDPTYIDARLKKVAALVSRLPAAVNLDQYANPGAPEAHFTFTGPFLWAARKGQIDALVAPIGTGGTFGGVAHFLAQMNPRIRRVPVDCEGSIVLGGPMGPHLLTGMGAHIRCTNALRAFSAVGGSRPRIIGDTAAFRAAHWVHKNDGIWVGGSSGAALAAVDDLSREIQGKDIVVICPDGGAGYVDTVFDSSWLDQHGIKINLN